jgi:hypothetical protein
MTQQRNPAVVARTRLGQSTILNVLSFKADKALQAASGGFSLFGGREEKYQNAADLYVQAANAFKMAKMSTGSRLLSAN